MRSDAAPLFDSPSCQSSELDVVVPLFNKGARVAAALHSVLSQTVKPGRIIVVDDGSTDDGPAMVRGIPDPRVLLISQSNQGVSAARNRGVALAQSELIAFLDADDEWLPEHLESILRLRQACPACHVFATAYLFRSRGSVDRKAIVQGLPEAPWQGIIEDYFGVASQSDPPLWSSAVAVTKQALTAVGGFPVGVALGEDLLTWARLAARFPIAYATTPSAVFWRPTVTQSSSQTWQTPDRDDPVGQGLAELLTQGNGLGKKSLLRYIGLWHRMRGICWIGANDMGRARQEFRKAGNYLGWTPKLLIYMLSTLLSSRAARLARYSYVAMVRAFKGRREVICGTGVEVGS